MNTVKHQPATRLPVMTLSGGYVTTSAGPDWPQHVVLDAAGNEANAKYAAHAWRAYPLLLAALQMTVRDAGKRDVGQLIDLLHSLGESA